MTDLMIDIETLGTAPGSVIAQVGLAGFELTGDGAAWSDLRRVNVRDAIASGLVLDWDTIQWWSRQSAAARKLVFNDGGFSLRDVLSWLTAAVKRCNGSLWAQQPRV
jgi:hypothetical protein